MNPQQSLEARIEVQATYIKMSKVRAATIHRAADDLRVALETAEVDLEQVTQMDDAEPIQALARRYARCRELLRMMETGSLTLEAERALDGAWRRLP